MEVTSFLKEHFKHYNSALVIDAAEAYKAQLEKGNKMLITLAGAFSTAEGGKWLAELIRQDKVHAISCTGANLEEDIFNLVAHNSYTKVDYRSLTPEDEKQLEIDGKNRVTDTCIPEEEAMLKIEGKLLNLWQEVQEEENEGWLPHEFFYEMFARELIKQEDCDINLKDSWVYAAYQKNLPIFVPGWEDSTLGNMFAARVFDDELESWVIKSGVDYMVEILNWLEETTQLEGKEIGFWQLGGGIAGDFVICAVPAMRTDLEMKEIPYWSYFCQITDATESYGGYSGAHPNEKITWSKLNIDTPKFTINSDHTIVAPLMAAIILNK